MNRSCFYCKKPIEQCMGFVCARDFLELAHPQKTHSTPRELCALCGYIALENPTPFYNLLGATSPSPASKPASL